VPPPRAATIKIYYIRHSMYVLDTVGFVQLRGRPPILRIAPTVYRSKQRHL